MSGRGPLTLTDLLDEFGMTDEEVAEMDRQWESVKRAERHETDGAAPDDGLTDTCVECGMTNQDCTGDCLYAN